MSVPYDELVVHSEFFRISLDLHCTADRTMHFRHLNPAWTEVLGWTLEELMAQPFLGFVHPEDRQRSIDEAQRLTQQQGVTLHFDNRYRHRDGSWVPLSWVGIVKEGLFYGVARDMRLVASKERALVESEARLRVLFEGMTEGVVLQDGAGAITHCNAAAESILGLTVEQMRGLTSIDPRWRAVHADGSPFPGEEHPAMVTLRTGKALTDVPMGVHKPSGALAWIAVNSQPVFLEGAAAPAFVIATFRDVTEKVLADRALAQERSFLAAVLANVPSALVGTFGQARTFERIFGQSWTEVGAPLRSLAEGAGAIELDAAAARCLRGETSRLDVRRGAQRFEVRLTPWESSTGTRGLLVAHDVTERDALLHQLARQERLLTAGTLAAGVGHEINNPLAAVQASLEHALEQLAAFDDPRLTALAESLEEARGAALRIGHAVRGLQTFGRAEDEPAVERAVDLTALVNTALDAVVREVRRRATLRRAFPATPVRVVVDEVRLSQVVVHLVTNAAQAFLTAEVERNHITVRLGLAEDGWLELEVEDDGPGIPEEILPRIFDPFFTTKPVGRGVGLGLSICHDVVMALGGRIECHSVVGRGTTFRVRLPASRVQLPVAPPIPATDTRRGRVLIIDDEDVVIRAIARLLERDHDVRSFSDSREALEHLRQESYDVVLCDLMMPHLTGMDVYRALLAQRPEVAERVVFTTGGVIYDEVRAFLAEVPNERLDKPFTAPGLRALVRRYVR